MNISQILSLTGMGRDTFNNLRRRGALPFFDRPEGPRQDRFTIAHAVALKASMQLREQGMSPMLAGETMNASWGDVARTLAGSRDLVAGCRWDADGAHEHIGWPNGMDVVGELSVKLGGIADAVCSKVPEAAE